MGELCTKGLVHHPCDEHLDNVPICARIHRFLTIAVSTAMGRTARRCCPHAPAVSYAPNAAATHTVNNVGVTVLGATPIAHHSVEVPRSTATPSLGPSYSRV